MFALEPEFQFVRESESFVFAFGFQSGFDMRVRYLRELIHHQEFEI